VLFAASAALIVSLVDKSDETGKDTTRQSQVTLSAGNFTISDPAKIQNNAGTLRLIDQGGGNYATDAPYVTSTNPINYVSLGGFTQQLGGNNAGQVTYRLSPDGTNWYWWNGSGWAPISVSNTIDDANTAAELNDHLDEFAAQFGAGNVFIRAFFRSNGTQQVELQNVRLTIFMSAPPTVSSVNPSTGPVTGGTNVTINGSGFSPPESITNVWTTEGSISSPLYRSMAIVQDKIFLIGGWGSGNVATVQSAPLSNPVSFSNGPNLPVGMCCSSAAVIDGYLYQYGSYANTTIYKISANNLIANNAAGWTDTGYDVPNTGGEGFRTLIFGNNIYYFANGANVYAAPLTDPANLQNTGTPIGFNPNYAAFIAIGNKAYAYVGNKIYWADISAPTIWQDTGKILTTDTSHTIVRVIGETMYLYGTGTVVLKASIHDPTTWTTAESSGFPGTSYNSQMAIIGNKMYFYNGGSVYSTPITGNQPNIYNPSWVTDRQTIPQQDPASVSPVTFGGVPATNVQYINSSQLTATVPAHSAGQVNVVVTNYDGQSATLTNGFEYIPPPTITGVIPSNGSTVGGDAVTITGTGFRNGATVKFGQNESAGVTVVNSTTITAATPANFAGIVDITVTNADAQKATKTDAFTYLDPPPQATTITPNGGAVAGGTNVTITGTGFIPPNTITNNWADTGKTIPADVANSSLAVVGDKIYMYGGYLSAGYYSTSIYSAPVSDPTTWTNVTAGNAAKTTKGMSGGAATAVIGDKIYMFGGRGSSNIYSAPVSDPTTVTNITTEVNSSKKLPTSVAESSLAIIGDKIYLFGGDGLANIYSAPVSDPTTWTDITATNPTKKLPVALRHSSIATIGNTIYLFGGLSNTNIYSASTSDPTTWTDTGKDIPGTGGGSSLTIIDNTIYMFGGFGGTGTTNTIYSAPVSDPTTWTTAPQTIAGGSVAAASLAVVNNTIYMFGGMVSPPYPSNTNIIRSAPVSHFRNNFYNPAWTTNWNTTSPTIDQSGVSFGGIPATNITFVSPTQITATTPAHAAGAVNVIVKNHDGQTSTIANGYEYLPPPSIAGITPNTGGREGGDSVTINGEGFTNSSTVKFGENNATNIIYVNSQTLIVTTPPGVEGVVDVVVTNSDGQTATSQEGFTYLAPPPQISVINPDSGPTGGGTNITITGSNFAAQSSTTNLWTTGPSAAFSSYWGGPTAIIGDTIYKFGGGVTSNSATNGIFSAPVSNPTAWVNTGKTIPGFAVGAQIAVIGNTIYMFGGNGASPQRTIYTASVSDPTTWTNTGKLLPAARYFAQLAIVGDTLYLYGGYSGSGGGSAISYSSATDTIYTASVSDPTTWTDTGVQLPSKIADAQLMKIGNTLYLYGGYNGTTALNTIYSASTSDPKVWTQAGTLPVPRYAGSLVAIGSTLYLYGGAGATGGQTRTIYTASAANPTVWSDTGLQLSAALGYSSFSIINDKVYFFGSWVGGASGGGSLFNNIYSAPIDNVGLNYYNRPWTTNWQTSSGGGGDQSNVTFGGVPATNIKFVSPTQITATTPAHSAGQVDVTVTNADGQSDILTSGYTYIPPPTITGVSPPTGSTAGGDSVTVSGENFRDGATVSFGGIPATNVTFINASTLIVTTPANYEGAADIVVVNPDNQSAMLDDNFTYISPPPTITSTTPESGATSGGTNVTITGSNFVPANSTSNNWTLANSVTRSAVNGSATAVIGNTIYMFGGGSGSGSTNTIWSAPVSDPTTWTNTGKTLPAATSYASLVQIGDRLYMYGGRLNTTTTATNTIWSAPVSDPTTWTNVTQTTGKTLPANLSFSQVAVIDNSVYLFGGRNTSTTSTNAIYRASTSDPTTWTMVSGKTLPGALGFSSLAKIDDTLYLFGGASDGGTSNTNVIYSAPVSDPTTWTNVTQTTGKTLPAAVSSSNLVVIGNSIYLFGGTGSANAIYRASTSDPTTWTTVSGKTLPGGTAVAAASVAVIDSTIYLFGGSTASAIYSAPITRYQNNYYNNPLITNWSTNTPATDQSGVTFDGVPATNVQFVSPTQITATTPAHSAGQVDVEVANFDGQSGILSSGYTYIPPPEIISVDPSSGPMEGGDLVTITGNNFVNGATVKFGNIDATNATFIDSSTLVATTPSSNAGTKNVTVTNPDGQSDVYANGYTFMRPPPTITSIAPTMGTMTGGTDVTITGMGFPIDVAAIANGGTASASGSYTTNTPDKAFDHNPGTVWTGAGGTGYWLQSMFDDTYSIGQIRWTACGSDNAPREAQLQLYQNGSWVTKKQLTDAQASGGGEGTGHYTLPTPEDATGIRLYFNSAGGWVTCNKLQALAITSNNSVTFDGIPATDVIYGDPTEIRVTTPAHAPGKVDVTVTDEFGQSVTLTDGYEYMPDNYAFTNVPLNVAATEPGALTVEARDIDGNPVTSTEDITLKLSTSSDSGFFARDLNEDESTRWSYDSVVLPAGQSSVTFYYKDNFQGTPIITAKDPNNTQAQQQQTIGPRYKLLVTGVTDPVQAGVPSSVTVQAVDYQGQPQTDYTGTVHFTSTDASALLPSDFTFTPEMLGLHTFVNGVTMRSQGEWCVTATDTISASITGSQCDITVTPPNAGTISKLKIITQPQSFPADGHSSAITVQTQDVNGLPIPVASDTTVYVYSDSGTGQFSTNGESGWTGGSPYPITIAAGTTSANVYYKDTATGTHTITMRDDQGTGTDFGWTNDSQPITVGVGDPAQLGVTTGSAAAAGEWIPVTVHLQDSVGNDVTSFKNVSVHMTSNSTTARFSVDPSGSNPVTALDTLIPAGSATATLYVSDITAGQLILTATDSSPPGNNPYNPGNVTLTVGPGEPVAIGFLPIPDPVRAGEPKQIAAYLKDIYGNTAIATDPVNVDFTTTGASGGFSTNTAGPWTSITNVIINPGASTAPIYYRDTTLGNPVITASTTEFGDAQLNLQVIAGPYNGKLGFKSAPAQFTAGTSQPIQVELLDDYGNPTVADNPVPLVINSSAPTGEFSLSGISWSPTISPDILTGQGSVTVLYRDTKAGNVTIGAQENSKPATRITYSPMVVAAAPAKYVYTSNPQIIAKNATSNPIVIELQDQYNNPASAPNGFSATINTTSVTGEFSLNGTSGWTNSSLSVPFATGASSATVRYRDSINGTYALTTSGNSLTAANQNIRVVEGVPGRIVLSSPGNVIAGEPTAVTLKTQTSGGIDTPVLENTTFNLSGIGEFSLSESPWNAVTSVTLNEGEGETTLYYRSTQAGINTVTAHESPSQGWTGGSTDIVVGGAEVYRFGFTTKPTNVPVTEASGTFTVSTLDIYGNVTSPSSDTTAYLYTTAGTGAFSTNTSGPWSTTSVTIPAGGNSATFHYRDTAFGTPTITASDKSPLENPDEDILNAATPIDVIGQQASKLVYTTAPQSITAGELSSIITIQLQKSDNTPAIQDGDRTFTFWPGGGGDQLIYLTEPDMGSDPVTEITIPRGQSSVNYYVSGTIAGEKQMDVYMYGFPGVGLMEAKQNIMVNAAAPESLVFTTTPQTVHAGEDSDQMKVELRDMFGNPTTSTTDTMVDFGSSCGTGQFSLGSGGAWSPVTSTIIPAGQNSLYFYYRDLVPATCTMTLSATGLTSAQQNIEVIYSAAVALDFTSAPQTIVAGQNSNNVTVSTKDIYGNIAPVDTDTTIYFSTSSASGQFSQNSAVIPAGQSSVSVTYRDTKPGHPTLQARDQTGTVDTGLNDTTQGITITAGTPTKFAYVPDTFNVVAGQLQPLKIELHNEYNVPYVASTNKTINLSTTVADGEFRISNSAGAPTVTQVTMSAGESSVTVYYRQTTAAVASLSAVDPDTGLDTGTALGTVFSDTLKGMRFVTAPQTLEGNQPSNIMTVAAIDEFGNTTAFAPTPMTLYLYSNSPSAKFYSDAGMTNEITSVTVNTPNTPAFSFYYRDTKLGASTITVSDRSPLDNPDVGLQNATQTVTIVPGVPAKLGIVGGSPELERGGADGPDYVVLRNAYDFEVNASSDQITYLSSSSGTGEFATSASGPWQSTLMVVIPSGQSRAEFYYRDDTTLGTAIITASDVSAPPETPDTGLVNGTKNITIISGAFAQLAFTTAPQTITARHPSGIMTIQTLNRYGKPTTVTANTTIYLRSNAATGEFATSASGPWGISSMVIPANSSTISFYYRDSKDGTPTLRASNSLSTNPAEVIATSQQQIIERQVLSHFLVTNISDPQYQGNPSSVVVAAVDSDNFVIDWYSGTVNFSASDGDAILPGSYTFNPSKDKGIHTFVNGVAFKSAGEKTVTATDTNGITGQQTDITVLGNPAGAPAKLVFITPPSPLTVAKNQTSEVITIQIQDSANMPTNAGPGGFPVRLTSGAATGEFATSASGPWQSAATFTVPEGLNYLNLYYRDSAVGQPQITARDWTGGVDNPAIANATLDVIVNALQITSSQTISSQNFATIFVPNPLFFANNETGDVTGRASFTAESHEERNGVARPVNWLLTWKNGAGTIIGQQTADNTAQISYNPSDVTARAGDDPFVLDIQAIDPSTDEISGATRSINVSPWQAKANAPSSYTIGNPLTIQVESRQNQNLADAPQGMVEILNSGLQPIGSQVLLTNMQHTGTGTYDASLLSPALAAEQTYYALVRMLDPSGNILAEDLSSPFQAQPGNTGGGGENPGGESGGGTTNPSNPSEGNGSDNNDTTTGNQTGTPGGESGGGTTSPSQNKPSTSGDMSGSTKDDIWVISSLGKAFKKFFSSPAAPVIVSNSLFGFVITMAVILLWQAYKELRQVRLLIAILEREKRTAEDKDNFLQLCAHYLRTPITIIAASSEMLSAKMGAVYTESTQTLATVVKNLQQKTEQLVTQTTADQNLQTIVAPDVIVERRKLYRNPMFWMPIILSVVLTILGNWATSSIGNQSVHAAVLLQQVAIAIIAIILLYTGLRLRAMRRKRKEMLAEALRRRAELDRAKNQFVTNTYDLLAGDVYLLAEIQKKLPGEEKFVTMLGDGTVRLEKLMDKFKLLATVDTTQLQVSSFTTTQVVNQALAELAEELKAKEMTVDRHGKSLTLQHDAVLFERVVNSILANATEFNNNGGTIDVTTKQTKDVITMTIRDNGPGFKQDPEQIFEAFKRGDDSLDFTHEGIGLDLYLDRLIMRHLGGTIAARNVSNRGAEVSLTIPSSVSL